MQIRQMQEANLQNLTQLWLHMGATTDSKHDFIVSNSWPYRCWFKHKSKREAGYRLKQLPIEITRNYVFPVCKTADRDIDELEKELLANNYTIAFQQMAMFLDINDINLLSQERLELVSVSGIDAIETWSEVCSRSFNYHIDSAVIRRISSIAGIELLLIYWDGKPAATVLIFQSGEIFGVHQLGVLPEYRGKGLARQIMLTVLQRIKQQNGRLVTLQASKLGLGLYHSLGFIEQFPIFNYRFNV